MKNIVKAYWLWGLYGVLILALSVLNGYYKRTGDRAALGASLVVIGCLVFLFLFYTLYSSTVKRRLKRIMAINSADGKINAINTYLSGGFTMTWPVFKTMPGHDRIRAGFMDILANAYIAKDDHQSAARALREIRALSAGWGKINTAAPLLEFREEAVLLECESLIWTGRVEEAEKKLAPLMRDRLPVLNAVGQVRLRLTYVLMAVKRGDAVNARKAFDMIAPEIEKLAKLYKKPDLHYDGVLMDGMIDKLEGKTESARQKLEDVVAHCGSDLNILPARRELESLPATPPSAPARPQ